MLGSAPTSLFIHEHKVGLQLQRQGNGFRLAQIQSQAQCLDHLAISYRVNLDPASLFDLPPSRPAYSSKGEFVYHSLTDMKLPKQCTQKIEVADGREVRKRRGIADDNQVWVAKPLSTYRLSSLAHV